MFAFDFIPLSERALFKLSEKYKSSVIGPSGLQLCPFQHTYALLALQYFNYKMVLMCLSIIHIHPYMHVHTYWLYPCTHACVHACTCAHTHACTYSQWTYSVVSDSLECNRDRSITSSSVARGTIHHCKLQLHWGSIQWKSGDIQTEEQLHLQCAPGQCGVT